MRTRLFLRSSFAGETVMVDQWRTPGRPLGLDVGRAQAQQGPVPERASGGETVYQMCQSWKRQVKRDRLFATDSLQNQPRVKKRNRRRMMMMMMGA